MPVQIQHNKCTLLQRIRRSLVFSLRGSVSWALRRDPRAPSSRVHSSTYTSNNSTLTVNVNKLSMSRWRGVAERAAPPRPSGTRLPEVCPYGSRNGLNPLTGHLNPLREKVPLTFTGFFLNGYGVLKLTLRSFFRGERKGGYHTGCWL